MVKYYFGNKEGLLVALLERDAQHTLDQLLRLLAMQLDPAEKMRRHLNGMLRTYFKRPYINRLLLLVLHHQSPERQKEIVNQFTRPLTEAYRQLIDDGVAAGLFRPLDPTFLYFQAVGICEQLFSARILLPTAFGREWLDRAEQGRFIAQTIEIFMAGISRVPQPAPAARGA
jgi:AcrR family transcriptional regulator